MERREYKLSPTPELAWAAVDRTMEQQTLVLAQKKALEEKIPSADEQALFANEYFGSAMAPGVLHYFQADAGPEIAEIRSKVNALKAISKAKYTSESERATDFKKTIKALVKSLQSRDYGEYIFGSVYVGSSPVQILEALETYNDILRLINILNILLGEYFHQKIGAGQSYNSRALKYINFKAYFKGILAKVNGKIAEINEKKEALQCEVDELQKYQKYIAPNQRYLLEKIYPPEIIETIKKSMENVLEKGKYEPHIFEEQVKSMKEYAQTLVFDVDLSLLTGVKTVKRDVHYILTKPFSPEEREIQKRLMHSDANHLVRANIMGVMIMQFLAFVDQYGTDLINRAASVLKMAKASAIVKAGSPIAEQAKTSTTRRTA